MQTLVGILEIRETQPSGPASRKVLEGPGGARSSSPFVDRSPRTTAAQHERSCLGDCAASMHRGAGEPMLRCRKGHRGVGVQELSCRGAELGCRGAGVQGRRAWN